MPLFIDVHTVNGATAEVVAGAHQTDLQVVAHTGVADRVTCRSRWNSCRRSSATSLDACWPPS